MTGGVRIAASSLTPFAAARQHTGCRCLNFRRALVRPLKIQTAVPAISPSVRRRRQSAPQQRSRSLPQRGRLDGRRLLLGKASDTTTITQKTLFPRFCQWGTASYIYIIYLYNSGELSQRISMPSLNFRLPRIFLTARSVCSSVSSAAGSASTREKAMLFLPSPRFLPR